MSHYRAFPASMWALSAQSVRRWALKQDCDSGPVCRQSMGRRG